MMFYVGTLVLTSIFLDTFKLVIDAETHQGHLLFSLRFVIVNLIYRN